MANVRGDRKRAARAPGTPVSVATETTSRTTTTKWLRSDGRRAPATAKILAAETEPSRSAAYPWLRSNGTGHEGLRKCARSTGRRCPMTSNFPSCQLVVLDQRRLPLNFPRPAADGLLADTFMQPGNLPKRSPKRPDRQTSLSRVATPRPTKRANRTLCRPEIDNTDSSSQVSDARRGIFDVTGQPENAAGPTSSPTGQTLCGRPFCAGPNRKTMRTMGLRISTLKVLNARGYRSQAPASEKADCP